MKLHFRRSPARRGLTAPLFFLLPLASAAFVREAAAQERPPLTPPAGSSQWSTAPTSSSGSDVGSSAAQPSGTAAAAPTDVDARVGALEAQLKKLQEQNDKRSEKLKWLEHIKISGYVQPQFLLQSYNETASPNVGAGGATGLPEGISSNATIAKPDGTTTNGTFFRVRRARIKTELTPSEYAKVVIEIDPNLAGGTVAGTGTIARNVEAIGSVPWSKDIKTDFGMGIFVVPFGFEIQQSNADRPFIERSWWVQNLFPGEYDTGVRAYTHAFEKKLGVQLAVINGITQGEKTYTVIPDLNRGKDFVGKVNYNHGPFDVGVSGIVGQAALVDSGKLQFKNYTRWGLNVEAALHHKFVKSLGTTKLFGEFVMAQNLDRGTRYSFALPTIGATINDDVGSKDQRALAIRLEQDITELVTLGLRYDMYTPDAAQKNNARDTYSFIAAANIAKGLKLVVEFDHAIDNVHRPGSSAPSKKIETFSTMLQARF